MPELPVNHISSNLVQPRNGNGRHCTVAFDTWPLLSRFRNNGIYVYARNLLSYFREVAQEGEMHFRPLVSSTVASDANQFTATDGFRPYNTTLLRIGRLWRYGGACWSARKSKADVLFCPSANTIPIGGLIPAVTTIHDIIPVVFPNVPRAQALKREFAMCARLSRAVITDSQHSKQDLVNVFRLPESKVHVVYLACDNKIFNDDPVDPSERDPLLNKLGIRQPFILHHGRIQERKNLERLIHAYRALVGNNKNLDTALVLVGENGWGHERIVAAASHCQPPERVVFTGPLSDPELAILLKCATLVVIPSLYEGFCLPLLEAMACGAPVICSNSSCLPEVSGGELLYFDPYSVEDMAARIEEVLEHDDVRQRLASAGKARASTFSWQRCAEQTLQVLRSATAS